MDHRHSRATATAVGLAAANPDQRAALVAKADELTIQRLPWIPDVQPATVLVLGKSLSGAVSSSAYLFSRGPASWAGPAE
jgi:hypothetical protein